MSDTNLNALYRRQARKKAVFLIVVSVLVLSLALWEMLAGAGRVLSLPELTKIVLGKGTDMQQRIVVSLRLPRIFAAALSGLSLAVAGAVMQSILRNPLGSPFTLGISQAAAFGAALALLFFVPSGGEGIRPLVVTGSAFAWALVACLFILVVARKRGASPENMILAGIIASSLFAALTSGLQFFADDTRIASLVYWTFGDLSKGGWREVGWQAAIAVPAVGYFLFRSRHFDALMLGDDAAQSMGIPVRKFRLISMVLASLLTASVVSVYGIIAFVGLVVPHAVRRIIRTNESFLLPASAMSGAAFLLLCDLVSRTLIHPVALPVGIVTSAIGAPAFLLLILGSKQQRT